MKLSSGCPYLAFTGNPLGDHMGIAPADAGEDSDCGLHGLCFQRTGWWRGHHGRRYSLVFSLF